MPTNKYILQGRTKNTQESLLWQQWQSACEKDIFFLDALTH